MEQGLTKQQFDILELLVTANGALPETEIQEKTGYSYEIVDRTIKKLQKLGYVENTAVTGMGRRAMEPYRVKRTIFTWPVLAAGLYRLH